MGVSYSYCHKKVIYNLMPTARKYQISLSDTPYYHCVSRCVRRAFLCGEDIVSGQSYEHRKQWVADNTVSWLRCLP